MIRVLGACKIQNPPKLSTLSYLLELVVIGCIRDHAGENGVDLFVTELLDPIQSCQILCHEIAAISGEILEIPRAKIVDHRQTRIRKFFLQRQGEIGADEAGSASDDEIG